MTSSDGLKSVVSDYGVKDATHYLMCSHCYSRGRYVDYLMPCIILKKMPYDSRLKVLVFGDRWHSDRPLKRIRYVYSRKVIEKKEVKSGDDANDGIPPKDKSLGILPTIL